MKINIFLLALPSLFYTVLGSRGHDCSDGNWKCEDAGDSVPFRLLACHRGRWMLVKDCSKSDKYCRAGPEAHCEFHLRG